MFPTGDDKEVDDDDDDKEKEGEKYDGSGDCDDLVDAKVNCCLFVCCCEGILLFIDLSMK